jgi:HemY protein
MVRLVIYLLTILLIASGLGWLADKPGTVAIAWQGYEYNESVFKTTVLLALAIAAVMFAWSIGRAIWNSPAAFGDRIVRRRQKRGLEALSGGMIAVGAGDSALAQRYALQARKALPHEPLTHLLRAQAAQLTGDRTTTRRIYEAMLASPETEQLGLRGLFLEAEREGETEAAAQFAGRALKTNPKLGWSSEALFESQCKQKDWPAALETLSHAKRNGHIHKAGIGRKRAVLLAAQAQIAEDNEAEKALALALEAHNLAPDLVPAAAVAGRILAARGNTGKAAKVLQKTWARAPHPELAAAYAYARTGDSARDRLDRIRQLAALNPTSIESPIAVATTAIEARMFGEARKALEPLLANRLTQRVATLMAGIEAGETGDKGKVREWLARAANAARDPVWFADGVISNRWEPVSPVNGRLDAYQWRVPVETMDSTSVDLVANRIEELLAIGTTEAAVKEEAPRAKSPSVPDIIDAEAITVAPARATQVPMPAAPAQYKPAAAKADIAAVRETPTPVAKPAVVSSRDPVKDTANIAANGRIESKPPMPMTPRAPDDPGTDDLELDDIPVPYLKRPYRAIN